jgi:glycerate dehydrogenase
MLNIVVLDGHTLNPGDLDWLPLQRLGNTTIYDHTPPDLVVERSERAEVLVVNKVILSREIIAQLPRLRHVALTATGYNNLDIAALKERNITASNIRNYGTDAVAQHTFALLLELCNHVGRHDRAVQDGRWGSIPDFCFWDRPITELAGKTMGILGWGHIGQRVGEIARAFGMVVIFHSSRDIACDWAKQTELPALFQQADVVSLHTHLSETNREFVNEALLALMKKSAFFLNTSRGALVDENALYHALENGVIAGAGLDVLSVEPPRDGNILIGARNCIITPHNAWASIAARQRMMNQLVAHVKGWMTGDPLSLVV